MTEKICPTKIITATATITDEKGLFKRKDEQIAVEEKALTKISGKGYVLFDFGKEMCGGIRIVSNVTNDCKVKITFGESVGEALAETGYKNAVHAHSIRSFDLLLPNYSSIGVGETGFRFVKIELLEDKEILVKSIFAENKILKKKAVWLYDGNDARLGEIFTAAKRTIDLCASGKYVWEGVKRDRLVWAGDLYSEMLALTTVYGRLKKIEDTIDYSRKKCDLPAWMNNIPSYSVWWLITLFKYVAITKNDKFLLKNLPYVSKLLQQLLDNVNDDGTFKFKNYFIDLDLHDSPYTESGLRALFYIACNELKACSMLGEKDLAVIDKLIEKLNNKAIECGNEKAVAALKFFAGFTLTEEEKALLINPKLNNSTFMSYFVLDAVCTIYGKQTAIEQVKRYFGKMLDLGATTFFETFNPEWAENSIRLDQIPTADKKDFHGDYGKYCFKGYRKSLCHGWSAGVIKLLHRFAVE
jgi:hypothetical protein